jgi:hypothetical protein
MVVTVNLEDVATARAQLPLLSDLRSVLPDIAIQIDAIVHQERLG